VARAIPAWPGAGGALRRTLDREPLAQVVLEVGAGWVELIDEIDEGTLDRNDAIGMDVAVLAEPVSDVAAEAREPFREHRVVELRGEGRVTDGL
jgi:hypothetical protein